MKNFSNTVGLLVRYHYMHLAYNNLEKESHVFKQRASMSVLQLYYFADDFKHFSIFLS